MKVFIFCGVSLLVILASASVSGCSNGLFGCEALNTCTKDPSDYELCHVFGDPHIRTMDGASYRYFGECSYTLVTPCDGSDTYQISAEFVRRSTPDEQAVIKSVQLVIGASNYTILFGVNSPEPLLVDGVPPAQVSAASAYGPDGNDVSVCRGVKFDNTNMELWWGNKIGIEFNLRYHQIFIYVNRSELNLACGLCGRFNDNDKDDTKKSNKPKSMKARTKRKASKGADDGDIPKSIRKFGDKWALSGSCANDNE